MSTAASLLLTVFERFESAARGATPQGPEQIRALYDAVTDLDALSVVTRPWFVRDHRYRKLRRSMGHLRAKVWPLYACGLATGLAGNARAHGWFDIYLRESPDGIACSKVLSRQLRHADRDRVFIRRSLTVGLPGTIFTEVRGLASQLRASLVRDSGHLPIQRLLHAERLWRVGELFASSDFGIDIPPGLEAVVSHLRLELAVPFCLSQLSIAGYPDDLIESLRASLDRSRAASDQSFQRWYRSDTGREFRAA